MQVSVEESSVLERRVSVEVAEDRIESRVKDRLQELGKTVRIDGFRPGRVPFKVVAKRFGARVRDEVVGEVLQSSLTEAITQEKLQPVGEPVIDPLRAEPGRGLSYTATFEVYPDIVLAAVGDLQIERLVCEIQDPDLDTMIATLREQHKTWAEVERAAAADDQLTIDYKGFIDGEIFEGGEASDFDVVMGAGHMIEGFEEGLRGKRAGDEVKLDLEFPSTYRNEDLAGKAVSFQITVKKVSEPVLPQLDDAFFGEFGVSEGGEEAFRAEVRENMQRERDRALKKRFNSGVLARLAAANPVEVPKRLVEAEAHRMQHQARNSMLMRGINPDQLEAPPVDVFRGDAEYRVKLGLIMAEMIKQEGITADPSKVRETVESMASSYEDTSAVVKWYYEEPQRLQEIEAQCLEDEAVTWIAERAQATEILISFDDLMNPGQTEQGTESE